eukprot:UN21802
MEHFAKFWEALREFGEALREIKKIQIYTAKKMIRKVKILSNKTPNRSRFCLQPSYFFPRFGAIGFRFAAFFFEGCFGFVLSFFCFTLTFFFGASFRFDFPSSQMW